MHPSRTVRVLLVALGSVFLLLGLIGIFMPVLPTTPFVLLAAACYARASTRFYNRLLNNATFGPVILEWQQHRSIPWRVKLVAIATMAVSFTVSIALFVRPQWLQVALAVFGLVLAGWLYRIPSRDRPGAGAAAAARAREDAHR